MMADAFKILSQGQIAGAAATTIYTVPALTQALVKSIILVNTSGASITVSVHLNGTTDAFNFGVKTRTLGSLETLAWEGETLALAAASYISVTPSAVTSVTYTVTGDEVT